MDADRVEDSVAQAPVIEHNTLVVENLQKRYGSRTVVKDVSLTVESGEVVGLLGPNGAGKTTCFYMVVGLLPLDDGQIALNGHSIAHLPIHRRARMGLSYLPQEASVFRKLTVEENVRAVLELQVDAGQTTAAQEPRSPSGSMRCSAICRLRICEPTPRCRCRAASGGVSRLRAHWRHDRVLSCSTSRLPASIRSRYSRSSASCGF